MEVIDLKHSQIQESTDIKNQQAQFQILQQQNQNQQTKLEAVGELIDRLKQENQQLIQSYQIQLTTTKNLYQENASLQNSVNEQKEAFSILIKEIEQLRQSRNDYKFQSERFEQNVILKNNELIEKIEELEWLKQTYDHSLQNIKNLEKELFEKLR